MADNADDRRFAEPWHPITNPKELRLLGKLGEETAELSSALFRCIIQGIDEAQPVTGKINRTWVEDEVADVLASVELLTDRLKLDRNRISERAGYKTEKLQKWHDEA